MKKFKVIWEKEIRAAGELREPGEIFEADEKSKIIKKLIKHGYIEVQDV